MGGHSLFDVKHTNKALSQTTLKEEDNPSSPPSTVRSGDERERLDHHPQKGPMNESTSSLLVGRRGSEQRSSIHSNSSSTTNVATATGASQHVADLSHTSSRVSSEQQPHQQQPQQNAYKKASKSMPRLYTSSNPSSQPSNNTLSSLFQFGTTSSNNGLHHTSHPSQQSVHHQHNPHAARPGRDSIDASTTKPFQVDHLHHHSSGVHGTRPAEPRARVAMLQPVMAKIVHREPLASVTFREDVIMTSDRRGSIKVWKRPQAPLATL